MSTKSSKKLGIFTLPMLTIGAGAEKYFLELAKEMTERGYDVDIITLDESSFKKYIRILNMYYSFNFFGPVKLVERETESSVNAKIKPAKWVKSSFTDLKEVFAKYDVLYVKNEVLELITLKLFAPRTLPVIVGIHTPLYYSIVGSVFTRIHNILYSSFIYKWLLSGFSLMHASNKYTYRFLTNKFNLPAALIYYPFSVSEQIEKSKKHTSPITLDTSKKQIAFIGRLCEQKGMDTLFALIDHLATTTLIEKISINIFGNGEKGYEDTITEYQHKYPWVKYYGYQENKYIPSILDKHDFLISPAKSEVLPFNILEAQALGVPVLCFDIPGPNDIVINNETGVLAKDAKDFISKLEALIKDEYTFDKEVIVQNIVNRFDAQKIYNDLESMFKQVIK